MGSPRSTGEVLMAVYGFVSFRTAREMISARPLL
jgi:hypothetical protein